jgi:hypothetical protein
MGQHEEQEQQKEQQIYTRTMHRTTEAKAAATSPMAVRISADTIKGQLK